MWSDVKVHINRMPLWKKLLWIVLVVAGTVLMPALLIWLFTMHGTEGLLTVNGVVHILVIVLICPAIVLPLLAALDVYLASHKPPSTIRLPSIYIWILATIITVIPLGLLGWLAPQQAHRSGDKAVQLLLADGTGRYGIPDMAVTFWTREPSCNSFKWGGAGPDNAINEAKPSQQHAFMLRDLQPDTDYWYKLNDARQVKFRTPPGKGRPLHFAVGSDSHFGALLSRNDLTCKMLQQIALPEHGYHQFFFLGDMIEHGFNDDTWQEALQAFSATSAFIPTRPVAGNHDLLFNGVNLYEDYLYPKSMALQTGSQLWQRIDNNNIHFLLLDMEWSAEAFTPAQAAWLEKQLSTIPANDWCIVMSHCFYYSSGGYWGLWTWYDDKDTISKLTPLFEKYGVDLVISGHNHLLELLQKNGVTYAI
jgi:acid phosphatase type 7